MPPSSKNDGMITRVILLALVVGGGDIAASNAASQIAIPFNEIAAPNKEVIYVSSDPSAPVNEKPPQAVSHRQPNGSSTSYNSGGKWEAVNLDISGVGNCAVIAGYGDHTIDLDMVEGSRDDVFVYLGENSWHIQDGEHIDVAFSIDGRRLEATATPGSNSSVIIAELNGRDAVSFLSLFRTGKTMTVRFGDTLMLEPAWRISLAGTLQAMVAQARCMRQWQTMLR